MNPPDPFAPPLTGCDDIQAQLSELADSGAPLPPEIRAHLADCPACAHFAESWLQGPPAALLASPIFTRSHDALRERILNSSTPSMPNIVQFSPPPISSHHPPRTIWLGRIAAALLVAGLAYWLLEPKHSTHVHRPAVAEQSTLSEGLLRTEHRSKREQQAVQTALVDGGREVRGNVAWAVSALEL